MPTILSHVAVPLAIKLGVRKQEISLRLLIVAIVCAVLPDADVVAFALGIPYESQWGHRGFTHSIGFALFMASAAVFFATVLQSRKRVIFPVILMSTFSHPLLDAATNGGLGCALLWPLSETRYFLPWTPIKVSPIGIDAFLTGRGLAVLESELVWVWLPSIVLALTVFVFEAVLLALLLAYTERQRATKQER
ncbi:MAG: metal-dependent hydrolase [Gammaproteobacteria bacterium]|nr:metal-dependent hydrolase [Gammaproteobacteria bacterium]